MRPASLDVSTSLPILVGYGPPHPGLDQCVPLLPGDTGQQLEDLAGEPLLGTFATLSLFVRHARSKNPTRSTLYRCGSAIWTSTFGRVLVLLGERVRLAMRMEWLGWCQWWGDEDHLVSALPAPGDVWYEDPVNRARAHRILCEARLAALRYAHERGI